MKRHYSALGTSVFLVLLSAVYALCLVNGKFYGGRTGSFRKMVTTYENDPVLFVVFAVVGVIALLIIGAINWAQWKMVISGK